MNYKEIQVIYLFLSLMIAASSVTAQIELTYIDKLSMDANKTAAEGDVYKELSTGLFYIGLSDGSLRPLQDQDWVKAGSSLQSYNLAESIYTYGNVGIGTNNPDRRLVVNGGSVKFSNYGSGTYLDSLSTINRAIHALAVDGQGDVIETNTAKANRVFYPPALVIDVGVLANNVTLDLYQAYVSRMGSPSLSSTGASAIPVYGRNELEYHVLDYDNAVFHMDGLTAGGVLQYDVIGVPENNCTYLNVIFVVK